ncbi:MAG: UDP-glucose/GDP-mannose dehydrogenase family protein [bacterium]|nr:UDP-glucose/GDP-mannose dehydrogenase family protein [bacterium]
MKLSVVGSGYVGLVAGACFADLGNDVICVDNDESKIKSLLAGKVPFYEPGLKDILDMNVREGRLKFTTDLKTGVENSEVIFIAVGTPPGANHEADLSSVIAVAKLIGEYANGDKVVVDKSTVPVGTAKKVEAMARENLKGEYQIDVVSNPEFLREGSAIKDFSSPDRIVVGVDSDRAKDVMQRIYRSHVRAGNPLMITDVESAELIKYASNAFLATKITFMNELARLCEIVGADVKKVGIGMGLDKRIGPRFLQAGIGYGGSCFPKDVKALIQIGLEHKSPFKMLPAVDQINDEQRMLMVDKLKAVYPDLKGKKIGLWGLAFKPRTDDIREAPAMIIIKELLASGAEVAAFDPVAMDNVKQLYPNIEYGNNPYEIVENTDALLLLTEWNEFRHPDFEKVKSMMNKPILIDGRNIYERNEMEKYGFQYYAFGR